MYQSPFDEKMMKEIQKRFAFVDYDPKYGKRIFMDNSGGSLRLTSSIIEKNQLDLLPDCPERFHARADDLNEVMDKTRSEILHTVFGAKSGSIITGISASEIFFQAVQAIAENVPGKNIVTSNVEHPSAYDAAKMYAEKLDLELRVVKANPNTGFIEPELVADLVDKDTIFVSIIAASNISGNVMDLKNIGECIRKKKKDVYFISDAVQHIPHGVMDVDDIGLDFVNFAPYKFFGTRGIGFGYASPRMAILSHHKLCAKPKDEWTLGTPTPSLFVSMLEVVDYVCWIGSHYTEVKDRRELYTLGMNKIAERERYLLNFMLEGDSKTEGLRHIENVKVFLDVDDLTKRDLIVAMEIKGLDHTLAVTKYQELGVTVYERINKSLYSKRILESLNMTGAIRVSPLHCQTIEDIRQFLIITEKLSKQVM